MARRSPVAMVFVAVAATAIQFLSAGASGAQTQQPPNPVVELVDQTSWVAPGEIFAMRVTAEEVPPDARVSLAVYPPLDARHDFTETLTNGVGGQPVTTPFSENVGNIAPEADGALPLSFDPGSAGLTEHGVYPLELSVTDETGQQAGGFLSFLLMLPPFQDFTPLTVATIFELGASPGLQPDGSVRLGPDELAEIRTRTDALEQLDVPVSVAPLPETLDSLALMSAGPGDSEDTDDTTGSDPDGTGTDGNLTDDLAEALAGKEVLARPYVDVDLETWAAADLVTEVPREAETGAQTVRLHYGIEPRPGIWLPTPTVGPTEAATWSGMGVRHSVLPPSAVANIPGTPWGGIAPPVQIPDGPMGFVSDEALVNRLVSLERPLDVHHFITELAMIWLEFPARPRAVVLRVPEQESFDPDLVASALQKLSNPQAMDLVTATGLFARYEETWAGAEDQVVPVDLEPKQVVEDLSWMSGSLDSARRTLEGLSDIVSSELLLASLDRSLLIAPGARTPPEDRTRYIDRIANTATDIADGINAPETFRITLTAREGTIPLHISNNLGYEVPVRVHLTSNQLEFPDGTEFNVVVPPEGIRTDLRVKPRTSGAFPLHITLTTTDGNLIVDETTFNVRSTVISGMGLVLSVGAGLFLIVWWTRHWRRTRHAR